MARLDVGDTDDEELARTWIAAQDLRLIFHCRNHTHAAQALYRWLTYYAYAETPELARLATTLDSWRTELLAYYTPAASPTDPPKPSTC